MISEQEVVGFVERNLPEIKRLGLSFFEITAAMAFEHFALQNVEVAVIETGLGGRLDATNIITPLVSDITNIGLDHTDLLGSTLQAVAAEKAGIIKRGVPVVLGERSEEYNDIFVKRAEELSAPLYFAQQQCRVLEQGVDDDMQRFVLQRDRDYAKFDVKLDLMGEYQYNNLITASAALDVLDKLTPLTISRRAYLEGLQSVSRSTSLAGRWQVLSAEPYMVCDTGHNAHGIKYVAKQLQGLAERYSKLYCVVGFAKEKSLDEVLPLLPTQAYYIFTQASSPRALPAVSLAEQAAEFGLKGEVVASVADAVAMAQKKATAKDAIFIGGSNFIVGEIPFL
jgi:dihydrofolate synthase/folylpolyglutamate synthase